MFKDYSLMHLLQVGGFTMYILLACSVISLGIVFERVLFYSRRSRLKRVDFLKRIKMLLDDRKKSEAMSLCQHTPSPIAKVALAGLEVSKADAQLLNKAMDREIISQTIVLERFTAVVGTIGSTAVYIGLFGTVLGIMHAVKDMSKSATPGSTAVIMNGISEALVCTAAGLLVAVPAVVAYNYFMKRIELFITDMELTSSEIIDILTTKNA